MTAWDQQGYAAIPRALLHDDSVTIFAKMAYIALSSFANRDNEVTIRHAVLAKAASMSVASARRALDELERRHAIEKRPTYAYGEQRANVYRLLLRVENQVDWAVENGGTGAL